MSSKYNTKQLISAGHYATQMSEIWCRKIQAFLRCSNFLIGIFYFASPCTSRRRLVHYVVPCAAASPPCGPAMQWLLSSVRHSSPVVCLLLVRLVDQLCNGCCLQSVIRRPLSVTWSHLENESR